MVEIIFSLYFLIAPLATRYEDLTTLIRNFIGQILFCIEFLLV